MASDSYVLDFHVSRIKKKSGYSNRISSLSEIDEDSKVAHLNESVTSSLKLSTVIIDEINEFEEMSNELSLIESANQARQMKFVDGFMLD